MKTIKSKYLNNESPKESEYAMCWLFFEQLVYESDFAVYKFVYL